MSQFTNVLQQLVEEFHTSFGHPVSDKPTLIPLKRLIDRKGWGVLEEMIEQIHSVSNNQKEFEDAVNSIKSYLNKAVEKQSSKPFIKDETDKIVALADGLADELYFLLGDCVEAGVDIERIFKIVQDSNMSKLYVDEDGNKYAQYDENGKIKKSPNFFPPEDKIKEEVLRQLNK